MTVTGCSHLLRDLGPIPPRYSGPPIPADTVVSQLTSAMAAEGVALKRTPREHNPFKCHESLTGEHPSATVEAALEAGFARARADHGWRDDPDTGSGSLSVSKGNWTATTLLHGAEAAGLPTTPVVITLVCVDGPSQSPGSSPAPVPTAS